MTRVLVKNGDFEFGSPLAKYRFMHQAEGKEVKLEVMEKPTESMRKYFEGCLVPAFFYIHPHSGWESFSDAREILKIEFGPGRRVIASLGGKKVPIVSSSSTWSKARFTQFVESITDWMREQGVPESVLDSEEYIRWRDTNFHDDYYPPLARLKGNYEAGTQ